MILLALSSCISSSVEVGEKRVSVFFTVFNIGDELRIGDDIVQVSEFKFALSRFNLFAEGDVVLQTSGDVEALIFAYTQDFTSQRLILDVGLGFSNVENFTGYEMFLEPVGENASILDPDFFGESENFSQVISGTVNENEFEFKTSISFERFFDITGVQLNDNEGSLVISKFIDLEDIFISSEGDFLDPTIEENEAEIMKNIEENLKVNFSAESII